jgi:LPLT family lysophospholipid transporter-like MFS transporter
MISRRNYPLLLASQFLGAFGDNATLAVILGQLTFQQRAGALTASQVSAANAVYASLFFVPYVLLAPLAGYLNDRFAKTRWLLGGNLIKLGGVALAATSVRLGPFWQGLGYFIVGVGSCVYSPAKYGVLPEIVERERLVKANGAVEFLTLIAILIGNIGGAAMIDRLRVLSCYGILMAIFATSLVLNLCMAATSAHPGVQLRATVDEFFGNFSELLASPRLFRVLCGTCMFWICGAVLKMNLQPWGLQAMKLGNNTQIAMVGLWLSIGIMLGSVLAGQFHRVGDLRWTRRYGWLLACLIALLGLVEGLRDAGWLSLHSLVSAPGSLLNRLERLLGASPIPVASEVILTLLAAGAVAGLFLIPLNATLQSECHQGRLGKTIATQNFIDNLGMVAAGGLVFGGVKAGLSASGVFLGLSIFVALVGTVLKIPPRQEPVLMGSTE